MPKAGARAVPVAALTGVALSLAFGEGDGKAQDCAGATYELGPVEWATLGLLRRDVHEDGMARRLLPFHPVKREIVKKVAQVEAGGVGGRGGKALLLEVGGEAPCGEG